MKSIALQKIIYPRPLLDDELELLGNDGEDNKPACLYFRDVNPFMLAGLVVVFRLCFLSVTVSFHPSEHIICAIRMIHYLQWPILQSPHDHKSFAVALFKVFSVQHFSVQL